MTFEADLPDALASAMVPLDARAARKTRPEFYLDVVVRSGLDVSIADAITGGDIDRTMEGASTLSLTLFDPHRALLRNPDLARAIDMSFAGYWWRMVKVSKSGDSLTLTFEDRDVAYLRSHKKPRAMARGTVTRAEFIRQLVREVGQRSPKGKKKKGARAQSAIRFVCPELHEKQPIGKPKTPAKRTKAERDDKKQPGLNPKAHLTVKGARATREQRRNIERALDVADEMKAGPKATKALLVAGVQESEFKISAKDYLTGTHVGIWQSNQIPAKEVETQARYFLQGGRSFGGGGAIKLARENSGLSAGTIATRVEGSGEPGSTYDRWSADADRAMNAYGGASGSDTGGTTSRGSSRSKKKYQFRRGEPGKAEDSWTAIQRLAEEVRWHAFMDRGKLYYVSDDWLMRQKARYVVDEDDDGILEINFDIDSGKVSSEVAVVARAEAFDVPVGSVMAVRECGVANGRYIVTQVHQGIYDYACEITLRAPTPKLPEPQAEERESTAKQGGDATTASGSLRDKIVAVAKASAANYRKNPGAWHYLAGGRWNVDDPTKPPKSRGDRSDCSQWVAAVYKKAGAPAPGPNYSGIYTGNMRVKGHGVPTSQAKPGDIILYGPPPSHHVELYVGPGQTTIGHGSPPVDEATIGMMGDPHCWRYDFLDD